MPLSVCPVIATIAQGWSRCVIPRISPAVRVRRRARRGSFLSTLEVAFQRKHPALEAQDLGVVDAFLPSGAFNLRDLHVDEVQGAV